LAVFCLELLIEILYTISTMTEQDEQKDGIKPVTESEVDDIEFESYNDDVPGGLGSSPEEKIRKLKEKLKQTEKEKQEYLDGWQRAKADFVNFKKREADGKDEFTKFARESLISDLLPVLESFDMAFSNKEAWQKVDSSWRVGVEYIYTQLSSILRDNGLTEIDPTGLQFDPSEHTAIGSEKTNDPSQVHKVAKVIQKGYRLSGKMLRSPKVKVYESEDATKGEQRA
jgi:molecular chaperone GrpE